MPIDPLKAALGRADGVSAICCLCEHYHTARDNGIAGHACLQRGCGSPIAGDTFHSYRGPIKQFDGICFVCGGQASHAVRVAGHTRVVGVCKAHVELVKTLMPIDGSAAAITILDSAGREISKTPIRKLPVIKFGV